MCAVPCPDRQLRALAKPAGQPTSQGQPVGPRQLRQAVMQSSVLHQRPRVPFYEMGRKKVPCSHYVPRWNVLLVKMMARKLEWLSHNGIDIGNCSIQKLYVHFRKVFFVILHILYHFNLDINTFEKSLFFFVFFN